MMKRILLSSLIVLLFATTVHAERLRIHWAPSSTNVMRYVVYRSTNESTGFAAIDSVAADTTYIDQNVPAGTRYYYRLRTVTSDGQRSVLSTVVTGVYLLPTDIQSVRISLVTKTGPNTYAVSWASTVPTAGFVRHRVENGTWITDPWDTTLSTAHVTTLTGLLEPARYEFRASGYPTVEPRVLTTSVSFFADLVPAPQPPTKTSIYPF